MRLNLEIIYMILQVYTWQRFGAKRDRKGKEYLDCYQGREATEEGEDNQEESDIPIQELQFPDNDEGGSMAAYKKNPTQPKTDKPNAPLGYPTSLEPTKLTTDITASEMEWWLRQWTSLKNVSEFRYLGDQIKILCVCQFVDRDILNAVGDRKFKEEKRLLGAIVEYLNEWLHPTLIR